MVHQQEVRIDIHVKQLKMKVDQGTSIRVVWSRGKKQVKTKMKTLSEQVDTVTFNEKF